MAKARKFSAADAAYFDDYVKRIETLDVCSVPTVGLANAILLLRFAWVQHKADPAIKKAREALDFAMKK